MADTKVDAESAIRQYLFFVEDPAQLIDQDTVAAARDQFEAAVDPIDRLHAHAAWVRAGSVDATALEERFVSVAARWAASNGIAGWAFEQLGVSRQLLRRAGFQMGRNASADERSGTRVRTAVKNRPVVTVAVLQSYILSLGPQRFTMRDVADAVGGSPMTVRKAFEDLVRSGVLIAHGPGKTAVRGRAPHEFSLAPSS